MLARLRQVGLFGKIFGVVIALVILANLTLVYFLSRREETRVRADSVRTNLMLARVVAKDIASGLTAQEMPYDMLKSLADSRSIAAWFIVRPDGRVYASSDYQCWSRDIRGLFPQANAVFPVRDENAFFLPDHRLYLLVVPIEAGGSYSFWLTVGAGEADGVGQRIFAANAAITLLLIVCLGGALWLLLGRILTAPLREVAAATRRVAAGNLACPVVIHSRDELGQLAAAFNRMTEDLRRTIVSKDYLDHVLDTMVDTVVVADRQGRICRVNHALCALLGYSPDELLGREVDLLFAAAPEESPARPLLRQVVAQGELRNVETVYRTQRGQEIPVLLSGSVMTELGGEAAHVVYTAVDVRELKRAEEALRLAHFAVDRTSDVVLWVGPDAKLYYVNEAACRQLGYSRDELLSMTVHDIDPDLPPSVWPDHWRELQSKGSFTMESRHRTKDGRILPVELNLNFLDFEGRQYNFAFARDITERKRAKAELLAAMAAAETANRAKSAFLANMSHEMRTPLTAILGYAELAMDPGQAPEDVKEHLGVVCRNGRHLLGLINDLLDISKIEAGKLVLEPRPCSVQAILADVVSMMRGRAVEKALTLSVRFATPVPETILVDEGRLRQCLVNLVGNALKFTEQGGVTIVTTLRAGGKEAGPALEIRVVDTGIGIPAHALQRLFQPFSQADPSTSRKYGGTGLGLVISRRLIEVMGGQLAVTSAVGQGSTFVLVVPTGSLDGVKMIERPHQPGPATAECRPPSQPLPLQGKRILLAEDGPDNQRLFRAILAKAGAVVQTAENGAIAVQLASADRFDLILMDMQMPEMDGYQATGLLRAKGHRGPIVALTANALASDRERCQTAGCTDYVAKPVDRQTLLETVIRHVGPPTAAEPLPVAAGE